MRDYTIIKNDFHDTEYRTIKTGAEIEIILDTAPWSRSPKDQQWALKVRRELCGIKGCTCGNDIGARGPQDWIEA